VNALVVPTNSSERLADFLAAWAPWPWDLIIVVQDEPELALTIPPGLELEAAARLRAFSWAEIDDTLDDPGLISRNDSAIRSFGFWQAWRAGAEIIFTLDDDCYPTDDDLVAAHRDNLYRTPMWTSPVPGLRVRGLPYRRLGVLPDVQISMGLWRGTPDLDAITTLAGVVDPAVDRVTAAPTRVMSPHQFFPMSGMNLAFRREVTCLMYFAPMGRGQPYGRFDDIWCGILAQRICRHLGYSIVSGRPHVDHRRASDPFRNLVKEAPGIAVNERLWETIGALRLQAGTPVGCMREAGEALAATADDYLVGWGRSIISWCGLFADAPDRSPELDLTQG
jgi:Reversibly glycosylated polypeptide